MHENKMNNKKYIGITSNDVKIRWKKGYGYSDKLPIGMAIRKYGWDGFEHKVLYENLSEAEAKDIEVELIKTYKTQDRKYGYNICAGGEGVTGWHPSEETRKKISASAKKRVGAENPNYRHKWSDEMKRKASERKRKENLSEETLQRMSEAAKKRIAKYGNTFEGKKHSDRTKEIISKVQSRSVKMFDKSGNLLYEFPSIKNAAENMGINKTSISNCCRGITKSSGGYRWEYSDKSDL